MGKPITIWQLGNTGLRNPMRIWEGLKLFAESPFNGNLRGSNEERFQTLLNHAGLVNSTGEAEDTSSYARKWRLMFARFGFIYPQVKKKDGKQEDLGPQDLVTPFGETFLKADTYPAQQECFLRSLSLEQTKVPGDLGFFSPLRWILAVMLELEKRTGTSEISRIEFSLWGHTTDPSYDINDVVNHIIDLRERRKKATAKRRFDADEIKKRGQDYNKKSDNFTDYSDMNMRYLRISGIVQRKGRGLVIVPAKHFLAEKLASTTLSRRPIMDVYKELCHGASLPMDDLETAKALLLDMEAQLKKNHVYYDLGNRPVSTVPEINAARLHLARCTAARHTNRLSCCKRFLQQHTRVYLLRSRNIEENTACVLKKVTFQHPRTDFLINTLFFRQFLRSALRLEPTAKLRFIERHGVRPRLQHDVPAPLRKARIPERSRSPVRRQRRKP